MTKPKPPHKKKVVTPKPNLGPRNKHGKKLGGPRRKGGINPDVQYNKMKQAALVAVLTHKTTGDAAAKLGIGLPLLSKWIARPDFQKMMNREMDGSFGLAMKRLMANANEAVAALRRVVDPKTKAGPSCKVNAARAILEYSIKVAEITAMAARMDRLEEQLNQSEWQPKLVGNEPERIRGGIDGGDDGFPSDLDGGDQATGTDGAPGANHRGRPRSVAAEERSGLDLLAGWDDAGPMADLGAAEFAEADDPSGQSPNWQVTNFGSPGADDGAADAGFEDDDPFKNPAPVE